MAYTEKVSLNGTALSFLLYECMNSVHSQEGFLIGDVTSEITNHISDSHNDNARLDTQILISTVLPLPSVSLFYLPTGTIREDVLSDLLSDVAKEVVGWYKYRKNSSIKPSFRDKLISKGLQKYFEKYHGKKTFVSCNISSKVSSANSTHTVIYRFGKMNCFDMYEHIEDITANLGEKLTGYKKANKVSAQCIFNKIVTESKVQTNNSKSAILSIQEAVNVKLLQEAKIAAKNESTIRELEAEIRQMSDILADKQTVDIEATYNKILEEKFINREVEMAQACIEALKTPPTVDILSIPNVIINTNSNNASDSESSVQLSDNFQNEIKDSSPSPIIVASSSKSPSTLNYAAVLKKTTETPSTSKSNFSEDLITFEDEDKSHQKPILIIDNVNNGGSSPEY